MNRNSKSWIVTTSMQNRWFLPGVFPCPNPKQSPPPERFALAHRLTRPRSSSRHNICQDHAIFDAKTYFFDYLARFFDFSRVIFDFFRVFWGVLDAPRPYFELESSNSAVFQLKLGKWDSSLRRNAALASNEKRKQRAKSQSDRKQIRDSNSWLTCRPARGINRPSARLENCRIRTTLVW